MNIDICIYCWILLPKVVLFLWSYFTGWFTYFQMSLVILVNVWVIIWSVIEAVLLRTQNIRRWLNHVSFESSLFGPWKFGIYHPLFVGILSTMVSALVCESDLLEICRAKTMWILFIFIVRGLSLIILYPRVKNWSQITLATGVFVLFDYR